MGFLIGIAGKIVGEKFAGLAAYLFVIGALVAAVLWLRADAYSDGVKATDDKWVAAGEKLKQQAAAAQGAASAASISRTAIEVDRVQKEKEKLDAAEAQGSSPLDVLFGS